MNANIDTNRCIWCGLCAEICPEVFSTQNGSTTVRTEVVPVELEPLLREAVSQCPLEAISIV